jgi:hypothetical protein
VLTATSPIVVLGANHSGTRLLVDIVTALGSEPGDVDNPWRENTLFLELHRELIARVSSREWDRAIFDTRFLERMHDTGEAVPFMRRYLERNLEAAFPNRGSQAWHWKCPTAILFLPSWLEIYPDAYYVHLRRRDRDVAHSLLRRRTLHHPARALRFNRLMNEKVEARRGAMTRYLLIEYEELSHSLRQLAEFLPLERVGAADLERAASLIEYRRAPAWERHRSVRHNLWLLFCRLSVRLLGPLYAAR